MNYRFEVTCPRCGQDVQHATGTNAGPVLTLAAKAVTHCPRCRVDWLITLELAPADRTAASTSPGPSPCGTNNGYHTHLRHKTPTCQPCRDAHRIYIAGRGRSHKKKVPA